MNANYRNVLADLKAKRATLDRAIEAVSDMLTWYPEQVSEDKKEYSSKPGIGVEVKA